MASCDTSVDQVDVPDAQPAPDARPVCGPFNDPLAAPGDPIVETYGTTAVPFFEAYCTSCHSSERTGADRRGAPLGFDWDDQSSVYDHLPAIRRTVGVTRNMPPASQPLPECDEREALVRWIDGGAPMELFSLGQAAVDRGDPALRWDELMAP